MQGGRRKVNSDQKWLLNGRIFAVLSEEGPFCSWMIIWRGAAYPAQVLASLGSGPCSKSQQDLQEPQSVTFIFAVCAGFKPGGVKD